MLEQFQLNGQTALVTGCTRGIGRAMAIGLAEAGAHIIGVSSTLQPGSALEDLITSKGVNFSPYACDFSDTSSIEQFLDQVMTDHPRIEIVINNAGIIRRDPSAVHAYEDWKAVLNVNLDAPFLIAQQLGARMIEQGYGRITFTASLLSYQGGITVPGYAASKGAIAQLVKALSNEWAGHGVTVNGIAPGYIATDATEALRNDPVRSQAILERIPTGRWGEPEDLASAAVFLSSPAAAYITGQILLVDGGWMAR